MGPRLVSVGPRRPRIWCVCMYAWRIKHPVVIARCFRKVRLCLPPSSLVLSRPFAVHRSSDPCWATRGAQKMNQLPSDGSTTGLSACVYFSAYLEHIFIFDDATFRPKSTGLPTLTLFFVVLDLYIFFMATDQAGLYKRFYLNFFDH